MSASGKGEGEKPRAPVESLFEAPPAAEQERIVEALLFASAAPLSLGDLQRRMPEGSSPRAALDALRRRYEGRGVRLERAGDGWAFRTAPDLGWLMTREVVEERPLSRAATETLAIIAYHQPVTRAEIEEIRGVAVSKGTIDILMERGWVAFGRRRMTPGRPVTFVVTAEFLDHFGLANPGDLPGVKELREAGLLENRYHPGRAGEEDEDDLPGGDDGQEDMFRRPDRDDGDDAVPDDDAPGEDRPEDEDGAPRGA
ncbi:SMC-Scp complex subunit ScpB [Rhodovulum sp. DZ06]|uniref:SMC-Scp complex subunit ScpB n=1 Tax=Rhodovulum sp. DZ06 TaxID=3425126 RepID=UPI003D32ED5D